MVSLERHINKHVFVWLGNFVGGFLGLDRFMRGQILLGVLKLLTIGGLGIWYTVDLCIAAYKAYANQPDLSNAVLFVNGKWA